MDIKTWPEFGPFLGKALNSRLFFFFLLGDECPDWDIWFFYENKHLPWKWVPQASSAQCHKLMFLSTCSSEPYAVRRPISNKKSSVTKLKEGFLHLLLKIHHARVLLSQAPSPQRTPPLTSPRKPEIQAHLRFFFSSFQRVNLFIILLDQPPNYPELDQPCICSATLIQATSI